MSGKFELKKAKDGQFHFNLLASNGQVIGTSELYKTEASRDAGIESVKTHAPSAATDDQTTPSQTA